MYLFFLLKYKKCKSYNHYNHYITISPLKGTLPTNKQIKFKKVTEANAWIRPYFHSIWPVVWDTRQVASSDLSYACWTCRTTSVRRNGQARGCCGRVAVWTWRRIPWVVRGYSHGARKMCLESWQICLPFCTHKSLSRARCTWSSNRRTSSPLHSCVIRPCSCPPSTLCTCCIRNCCSSRSAPRWSLSRGCRDEWGRECFSDMWHTSIAASLALQRWCTPWADRSAQQYASNMCALRGQRLAK